MIWYIEKQVFDYIVVHAVEYAVTAMSYQRRDKVGVILAKRELLHIGLTL